MELGRALAKLGQREAALKELEQALTMDVEDINAHLQKVKTLEYALELMGARLETPARAGQSCRFCSGSFKAVCITAGYVAEYACQETVDGLIVRGSYPENDELTLSMFLGRLTQRYW